MYQSVRELIRLLTPYQRRDLVFLQALVILMAFAEISGVASIGPFMALVGNIGLLQQDNWLAHLYHQSGLTDPGDFVFRAGVVALLMMAGSAAISVFTLRRMAIFGNKVGIELGNRLFEHFMYQPWLYHASASTAILNKKIASDTSAVTGYIIQPLLSMNARCMVVLFIAIPMIVMNPLVALVGLGVFGTAYFVLYRFVRATLARNGAMISKANGSRFLLMLEGFGGIKDVLLLGRQGSFIRRFRESGMHLSHAQGNNQIITQVPRYFMEVIAFGLIILLVLYLVKTHQGNLGEVLPTLAIYALAGMKLLPALQNIYLSISNIRTGLPAFESIHNDLVNSRIASDDLHLESGNTSRLQFNEHIVLKDVSLIYPGKVTPALDHLDLTIPAKKVVGLVGATGSGKSTTIDLILGLIEPDDGQILIDGQPLAKKHLRAWQDMLGYVPQSIYLANVSIIENVGFGLPREDIDEARAIEAMERAHLSSLLQQLPQGMETVVGERGVQLSGGQRQRIGIARALYHDADVLVLDEATSALDGITEKVIMQAIQEFSGQKTIIMIAHRLTTVRHCDIIYLLDEGRVQDSGTYNELLEKNATFRKMAAFDGKEDKVHE